MDKSVSAETITRIFEKTVPPGVEHPRLQAECQALFSRLANEARAVEQIKGREPWLSILIGSRSKESLIRAVLGRGHQISRKSLGYIRGASFAVETQPRRIELVNATMTELRIPGVARSGYAPNQDVYSWLDDFGFEPCPVETALQLCLNAGNVLTDEQLTIVTRPLPDHIDGSVPCLTRLSGKYLIEERYAYLDYLWRSSDRLVFCRKTTT